MNLEKIYFKHIYQPDPHEWGVIGLPKNQQLKELKDHNINMPVLLAITKDAENEALAGKVFGYCNVYNDIGPSREYASEQMVSDKPDYTSRWEKAILVYKCWFFEKPFAYDEITNGKLQRLLQQRRGALLGFEESEPDIYNALLQKLQNAIKEGVYEKDVCQTKRHDFWRYSKEYHTA